MSLLSTIASIVPTIGTIVGRLLGGGVSGESEVIVYNFEHLLPANRKNTLSNEFQAAFVRDVENDEFLLVNNSMNPTDTITLTTPAMGDMNPTSITIPGDKKERKAMPLKALFEENAKYDNSKLEITASPGGSFQENDDDLAANDSAISMTMSGRNILVNGADSKKISPYLSAKLTSDTIELTSSKGMKMSGIRSLSVDGSGDSGSVITNVSYDEPTDRVIIKLPTQLVPNDLVDIGATMEFSSVNAVLQMQQTLGVTLRPVSDKLLTKIKTAAKRG